MPSPRRLTDARELSALAHPVRLGIIEHLSIDGPLTATELGDRLDESPANCSWHLRKLAEHGFVEEAEGGHGRRRPWRMRQIGFRFSVEDLEGESVVAAEALETMLLERQLDRFHAASRSMAAAPPPWRGSAESSQSATWLTAEELGALQEELRSVMARFEDRLTDPARRPPGSRLCEVVALSYPVVAPGLGGTRAHGGEPA